MATTEKTGTMKYKDSAGNVYAMLPKTKMSQVDGLSDALAGKAASSHTHDDRYYTESEMNTKLSGKSDTSHTHSAATTSAAGFMSSTDKSKLDGIAAGANKTTVDSAMSSTSTNPVQNKVVVAAIDSAIQSAIQNTWEASY